MIFFPILVETCHIFLYNTPTCIRMASVPIYNSLFNWTFLLLGWAWQARGGEQGRSGQEHGGRGVPSPGHDDQEEAQGPVQEHDEVEEAAREPGQAAGAETEGHRRADFRPELCQEEEKVRNGRLKKN